MDILPALSGSGTQGSPIPLEKSPSIPQLSTSPSDSPHQDTAILAKHYVPPHWGPLAEKTSHLSPVHSRQVQDPSCATACRETISGGHNTDSCEAAAALNIEVDEPEQTETSNATCSSPIANATSAWAETLKECGSDGNRVPFYPGKQFIYERSQISMLTKPR
jgi:hypothetical protein